MLKEQARNNIQLLRGENYSTVIRWCRQLHLSVIEEIAKEIDCKADTVSVAETLSAMPKL